MSQFSHSSSSKNRNTWKCELCGYDNNKYLAWCEICLVLREIQKNPILFTQLNEQLHGAECKLLYAQQIRDMAAKIRKLKHDIKRLHNCHKDKTIIDDLEQEIKQFYEKRSLNYNENMVQNFIKEYKFDEVNFEEQKEINKDCHPICICGREMIAITENQCYDKKLYSCVFCDICDKNIPPNCQIHHCPAKNIPKAHPHGFDICEQCRKLYIHRLRYFVALIICPPMIKGNIKCNDAEKMTEVFKKLGFQKIICVKGDRVTKQRIQQEIDNILPSKSMKNNVNQCTVICYSGHGAVDAYGNYYFDLNPTPEKDKSKHIPLSILQPLFTSTYDVKAAAKEMSHKTYYRHNSLLLMNSCHSGGASDYINAQLIADQLNFSRSKILKIIGCTTGTYANVMAACRTCLGPEFVARFYALLPCGVASVAKKMLNPLVIVVVAVIAGVSLLSASVIVSTVKQSKRYESTAMITSCERAETSNFYYPISPFVKHVVDYFDIFLNPKHPECSNIEICAQDMTDTPKQLFKYIEGCYDCNENEWLVSLRELGQTACYKSRGLDVFAMCPMFKCILK